jgi:U3 small nucleolar RNA-associated protein 14
LAECKKLKTLRCSWADIFPFDDEDSSSEIDDEPLEDGYHMEKEKRPAGRLRTIDLKLILPESIEALHLVSPFPDDTGERAIEMFTQRGQALPNLKGIFIDAAWKNLSGQNAEASQPYREIDEIRHNPLIELLVGHGS